MHQFILNYNCVRDILSPISPKQGEDKDKEKERGGQSPPRLVSLILLGLKIQTEKLL